MTKKQPSGSANRKRAAEKLALEDANYKQERLSIASTWNTEVALKSQYGSSFDNEVHPVITPEQIKRALELPIYGVNPPQTVGAINQILNWQTQGMYLYPAQFCDSILRDEKIYSFLQVRIKALVGSDITLNPFDESEMAIKIKEDCDDRFSDMMPLTELEEMLRWSLMLGSSISQIIWDTSKDNMWVPRLSSWNPKNLYYNWALREFRLITQNLSEITILQEDVQWSLFHIFTDHLPWNRAMILPLAMPYLFRVWNEQWWARHQERVGSPILGAVTSAEATPEEERLFIQQLFSIASNAVVRLPQGVEGNKFDLKVIQASSDMYEGFKQFLDYIDRNIAMIVMGQDKTNMAKTTGMTIGGNDAGEKVRLDLMRSDANNLSEHLREKILKPYVKFNYGEEFEDMAPYICFEIEEPEDLNERATSLNLLSQALTGFNALGAKLDFAAIFEEFSLPIQDSDTSSPKVIDPPKPEVVQAPKTKKLSAIEAATSFEELEKALKDE